MRAMKRWEECRERDASKEPTCWKNPFTSFISCRFTLRPIFGKRYYLIAPLHTLYCPNPTAAIHHVCIIFFEEFSCWIFTSPARFRLLFFSSMFLSSFQFRLTYRFSFVFRNLLRFNIEFSPFHLNLFDCLFHPMQFNFSENVDLFLQYHHYYTVFRFCFSYCQYLTFQFPMVVLCFSPFSFSISLGACVFF